MGTRAAVAEKRKRLVRRLGIFVSALSVLLVVSVFVLILRTENAHDEATCAFATLGERTLGDVTVSEESRNCLPEVEERRYIVHRASGHEFELARKRLPREHFGRNRYAWELTEDEDHLLVLSIQVDGKLLSEFHEADSPDAK